MSFKFAAVDVGPTPTVPAAKDLLIKVVKLTFADFTTGGTSGQKVYLPADCSITRMSYWAKTALSGGGITAATLSIGITGTLTKFLNAQSVLGATGTFATFGAGVGNILQEYDPTIPGGDIPLVFTGTATTGNPAAGELYVLIEYVR